MKNAWLFKVTHQTLMSICFFLCVQVLLPASSLKHVHPMGCLLWLLTLISQWRNGRYYAVVLPMVECMTFQPMVPSVCQGARDATAHRDSFWQHFRLMCLDQQVILAAVSYCLPHTFCTTLGNTFNNCQAHQDLMRKSPCLIIHQHGIPVSNYNYDIGW